jgi:hypothetical protein
MNLQNTILVLYLITLIIVFIFLYKQKHEAIEPDIFLNKKLSEADKIKMRVHSVHHDNKTMKKLGKRLAKGIPWEEAHADLPIISHEGHMRHVNIEMNKILLESFYITVGTMSALLSVNFYNSILALNSNFLWKIGVSLGFFLTILLLLSIMSMKLKHNLSFSSYDEKLVY